jgi:phospholipase/carboxylesterase
MLETLEIETAPDPQSSVIWLHGLGADGHDFEPIVPELDLGRTPVRFIFPHAPMMPVTINQGFVMRAWYDIVSSDLGRQEDEAGVRASQTALEALIERELNRGVAARRIVLAGFSQGGAIALQTGLRHPQRLAGVMGLSTYVPIASSVAGEAHAANRDVPIFMAHGELDPIVPIGRARESRALLEDLGYQVEWHEYRMPHAVCAEEIADLRAWLERVLG